MKLSLAVVALSAGQAAAWSMKAGKIHIQSPVLGFDMLHRRFPVKTRYHRDRFILASLNPLFLG